MKVTICFSGETPGDTYRPLYGNTRGDFRSHSKELVVHAGMDDFHRSPVAGIAFTTTHVSAILTVNRDKKREISLAVSSKYRKYRADRMAERIVTNNLKRKDNTTGIFRRLTRRYHEVCQYAMNVSI